ncbi:conserved Plasmodium protein, unknown function [Plasmodium ovale curtisi]|uniref:Uncharacterized protein n=1 Tax=Plasmodium ovale curtisi TaxID=864141 RepID=A0A1A8VKX8_PLAOA|nr:conserved Plasmodium protein, unknown function [Plasmodium ovale curtisi]
MQRKTETGSNFRNALNYLVGFYRRDHKETTRGSKGEKSKRLCKMQQRRHLNMLLPLLLPLLILGILLSPQWHLVASKRVVTLHKRAHISAFKNDVYVAKKYNILRKVNFLFSKKESNKYEMKNLENVPLFVVTNQFDEAILSFDVDYEQEGENNKKREKKENIILRSAHYKDDVEENNNNAHNDIVLQNDSNLLFPNIENNEMARKQIDLDKIQENKCIGIFFFDIKTAEAYKDDILYLFNKNLKEKKNNKLFFGSKIKLTNLEYFLKIRNKYNTKIDFVLIPHYNELQNVLQNKKVFYGTPIYYINKIKLRKSFLKKSFYDLFFRKNGKREGTVELYPNVFVTYSIEGEKPSRGKQQSETGTPTGMAYENNPMLIIHLQTKDKKKYVPIFFSYEHAYNFYRLFLKHFKDNFFEYCLPKPHIVLNSLENLLTLLKLSNENKFSQFHNIFFLPMDTSHDNFSPDQTNIFVFYAKKLFQRVNYDLFRSFRKNLNYLISDYLHSGGGGLTPSLRFSFEDSGNVSNRFNPHGIIFPFLQIKTQVGEEAGKNAFCTSVTRSAQVESVYPVGHEGKVRGECTGGKYTRGVREGDMHIDAYVYILPCILSFLLAWLRGASAAIATALF